MVGFAERENKNLQSFVILDSFTEDDKYHGYQNIKQKVLEAETQI